MGTKKIFIVISLAVIMIFSCKSVPDTVQENKAPDTVQEKTVQANTVDSSAKSEVFDPTKITKEQYLFTMEEVQKFIEEQNEIIKNKNFDAWKLSLSNEYFAEISSERNLRRISEQPAMKSRKITLKTARDYFEHVVVPSRADLHVDEIEFVSVSRVKAFTIMINATGEERRLRLYDLEKANNTWIILN
jgi:PBP1b-binding outer membrane lipoprotein LpoB